MFRRSEPIKDRIFVITGGAQGIGFATAQSLINKGGKVIICDINPIKGQESANSLGERASFYELDVSNRSMFSSVIEDIESDYGPIDVLINNAGILCVGSTLNQTEAKERAMLDINLFGAL